MWIRVAVFVVVLVLFVGLSHYYVWARLVRDPALPGAWSPVGRAATLLLATILVGCFAAMRGPRWLAGPLAWIAFVWLGVLFYLLVFLGVTDLGRALLALARAFTRNEPPPDPDRRVAVARILAGAVGVSTLGVSAAALVGGLRPVGVKPVKVALGKLPRALGGYVIAQITDIHVGPTIGRAFIEELVEKVNALSPDLIAITGDLVDGSVADLAELVRPLARLRARDGVFFVTGNHEYYSGVTEWLHFLGTMGIRVLANERVAIRGESGFDLAGVHDWSAPRVAERPDLKKALAGRDPSRTLVLLAHQPRHILEAEPLGVDLQLSGHTHGGQIWPWRYMVKLQQPYVEGLHRHGNAHIYVSSGTGYWGPPMRLFAPAEITRIEIVREGAG